MQGRMPPAGQALALRNLSIGDRVTIPVKGKKVGFVWGDNLYTLDSDPGAAAVHAGLLDVGETKLVEIWVVPSPNSFSEANRNGVRSRKWGKYKAAYIIRLADPIQTLKLYTPLRETY